MFLPLPSISFSTSTSWSPTSTVISKKMLSLPPLKKKKTQKIRWPHFLHQLLLFFEEKQPGMLYPQTLRNFFTSSKSLFKCHFNYDHLIQIYNLPIPIPQSYFIISTALTNLSYYVTYLFFFLYCPSLSIWENVSSKGIGGVLAAPHGMRDFNSLTRDGIHVQCIKSVEP